MTHDLGRAPSVPELAAHLDIDEDTVIELREKMLSTV
jgi:DNA-directed RNA polymerase specialized sigma subunit